MLSSVNATSVSHPEVNTLDPLAAVLAAAADAVLDGTAALLHGDTTSQGLYGDDCSEVELKESLEEEDSCGVNAVAVAAVELVQRQAAKEDLYLL